MKILSYEEEKILNLKERKKYYIELKEYLKNSKYSAFNDVHVTISEITHNLVASIIDKIKGYDLVVDGIENIPKNTPVIYASTHQDYNDHFNVVLCILEHVIILNTTNVTKLFKAIMWINSIIYVDRTNDDSKFNSKLEMMKCLAKDKSILVFPEATYNCSPNKLHLPFHSGIFDMAGKMNVPIVPMIQEYTHDEDIPTVKCVKSCHVRFGKPIYVNIKDDIHSKKEELSDAVSTIRWELLEEKGLFSRESVSNEEYINYVKSRMDAWSKINVDINNERKLIYGVNNDFYLFHHINDIPFTKDGRLLEPSEVIKLKEIEESKEPTYCFDSDNEFVDINKVLKSVRG